MHCHSFEKKNIVPKSTESHLPWGFFSCDKAIVRMSHANVSAWKSFLLYISDWLKRNMHIKLYVVLLSGCTLACSVTKFHIHYKLNSYLRISNYIKFTKYYYHV